MSHASPDKVGGKEIFQQMLVYPPTHEQSRTGPSKPTRCLHGVCVVLFMLLVVDLELKTSVAFEHTYNPGA